MSSGDSLCLISLERTKAEIEDLAQNVMAQDVIVLHNKTCSSKDILQAASLLPRELQGAICS